MKWRIYLIIYTIILLGIFLLAYMGLIPTQLNAIPYYDSIGHFFLYGIWGYLFGRTFTKQVFTVNGIICQSGILITIVIAIVEESLQLLSPLRTFSLLDLGWGLSGIITACLLINFSNKKNKIV